MTGTSTETVTASCASGDRRMNTRFARMSWVLLSVCLAGCVAQAEEQPTESPVTVVQDTVDGSTSFDLGDVQEPPVPYVGGTDDDFPAPDEPTEIDCVDAEELCDTGAFACDDIADYCDIGPDGLEELPDEYDWDGG